MTGRTSKRAMANGSSDWALGETLRAERYHHAGQFDRAARIYEKVLDRKPRCWPAAFNYAVLAHQLCQHETSIGHLRRIVAAFPGNVEALYNLGTVLQCVGAYEESERYLTRATQLAPDHTASWVNLGNARLARGDSAGAGTAYEVAMRHDPDNYEALYNRAHHLILSGQWRAGWASYEARWSIPGFTAMNSLTVDATRTDLPTPWQGQPLSGCRLLVSGEQGWGDDIMCLRYARALRDLGATTTWALRPGLIRLAALSVAPDNVISLYDPIPSADYVISTMSLHHRLGITPETVPGADGYLRTVAA